MLWRQCAAAGDSLHSVNFGSLKGQKAFVSRTR